jgi:hypothetical protein
VHRAFFLVGFVASLSATASAQSSQFGIRGLGLPGRAVAARAVGSGGAFALFDPESSLNPAALTNIPTITSVFTINQGFRRQENPAGSASTRDTRFPQLIVVGPVRQTGGALALSYSNYTNRDFTLATADTVDLRGAPVGVVDSLSSRGGLSDLRLAGAYRLRERWSFGAGFHVITGSNRLESKRVFDDPAYQSSQQSAEVSYAGVGVSAGLIRQLGSRLAIALMARSDGHVNVDRDSLRVGRIDLPYSFGVGFRWLPAPNLALGSHGIVRTWSAANSDLLQQGGIGSENTFEIAAGLEYASDPKEPYRRPLRLGARYGRLPFPVVAGQQGSEFAVSIGSGTRFAQQRGGVDLALEHVWRSEGAYSERAFVLSVGMSVRP